MISLLEQLGEVPRLPIAKRWAIHSSVTVVSARKAKAVDLPARFLASLSQSRQEHAPIIVIGENALLVVTTIHHVVNPLHPALTERSLARRLRPLGIRPRTLWVGDVPGKGYFHEDFLDQKLTVNA